MKVKQNRKIGSMWEIWVERKTDERERENRKRAETEARTEERKEEGRRKAEEHWWKS